MFVTCVLVLVEARGRCRIPQSYRWLWVFLHPCLIWVLGTEPRSLQQQQVLLTAVLFCQPLIAQVWRSEDNSPSYLLWVLGLSSCLQACSAVLPPSQSSHMLQPHVYSLVTSRTFSVHQSFASSEPKSLYSLSNFPPPLLPNPWIPLPCSMNMTTWWASHERSGTICVFLWLTYSTKPIVLKLHPGHSTGQTFSFSGWIIVHCM